MFRDQRAFDVIKILGGPFAKRARDGLRWRIFAGAALAFFGCDAAAASTARITILPPSPLLDQRLQISVSGLEPAKTVTLVATTRAPDGLSWRSEATFRSGEHGEIDLKDARPLSGSYHSADVMGLFWSMSPDTQARGGEHAYFDVPDPSKPIDTRLALRDGSRVLVEAHITRRFADSNVRARPASGGVTGILYAPADNATHPSVLVIGGSDGGPGAPDVAMMLASHGFAALSMAYFGARGLPSTLEAIPMEDFARAIGWLRRQPGVDPRFVALYGESRGTEPALWTAAHNGDVSAVVARSPSFVLWGGITARHLPGAAAWTDRGKPLAYIPNRLSAGILATFLWDVATGTSFRQTRLFEENLTEFDSAPAEIPVEKIRGPVLLLAGEDDQIWPSKVMADRIVARLKRHNHPYPDQLLAYPGVGHPVPYAYLPLAGDRSRSRFAVGGTPEGYAKAQSDAWPKMVAFLNAAAARVLHKR